MQGQGMHPLQRQQNYQGGQRNNNGGGNFKGQRNASHGQNRQGQDGGMNNNMQGRNNMQQNMGGNRGQSQQQMTMPTLPMPAVGGQAPVQMPQTQDPAAAAFYAKTHKIVPSVKADNPHLKQHVGNAIFDFVTQLRGQALAPKITGMLIDLPLEETQMYLMNYPEFVKKVNEAANLLTQMQQPQAQMPQPGMPMP